MGRPDMENEKPQGALLDEKLLRLFDALYVTRSVTRAAVQLGQAQPTVSIWLNRLRQELQDPLFVRTPIGMEPTPRAESLIGPARAAIASLRQLTETAPTFDPATAKRRFRICMTDSSHITLLPRLLAQLRAQAPGVSVEALQNDASAGQRLLSGEADLAVGLIPELGAGFFQQTLYMQDWVCLLSAAHPRVRGGMTRADYEAEAHIVIERGTGYDLIETAMAAADVHRRTALTLPGFLGLGALVSGADLVATLPRHIGETLAEIHGLAVYPCPIQIESFQVKQLWHARNHHDLASRWLRALFVNLFQHSGYDMT
jgi:DNA-binding transcriptional LysR family regulator